ncbi:hypothetical protein JI721_16030 [Alicyclobacillus cycloheptanicus]|uniref:Uncharacterized protein n=1 Tax=Alicyclobacillus cycloheptanicus TaxID=1457 RepID=A0ABT9XDS6_9BACL|nr:hypothetical protein [Alicyclobacillus cycloheptanicus]MDQ0188452.1 hypothetical protein [Alicyclobacillus cycloheptanicus]WDM01147.1 hypothetical protein JI721_16030 [Alicyclobacillus cycloheptanicus]
MSEDDKPWPSLPAALQHRVSAKWMTLEALRVLLRRRSAQGQRLHVLLLTPFGPVQGDLVDIHDTYEASLDKEASDVSAPGADTGFDVTSATVHLRTELWHLYSKQDDALEAADVAAVVRLTNATFRMGAKRVRLDELALFAGDIIGFSAIQQEIV